MTTFFAAGPYAPGSAVTLAEDSAHHIRVARIALGDAVELRDGAGAVASGTLAKVSRSYALVDVVATSSVERGPAIHLLAPVADRERMLWLVEKAAELGVTSWRPVMWKRSRSVSPRGEGPMFQAKTRARMIAALTQSGGAWLPDIFPESTVERAIAAAPAGIRLLLDAGGDAPRMSEITSPVSLAVGPEGGMENAERAAFLEAGFVPVRLAANTLRFETAAVAAIAVATAALLRTDALLPTAESND